MPTFSGAYIQEPRDFSTVTTESELIQLADDPDTPIVPESVASWAELVPAEEAALLAILNPIIIRKEGTVNGYLRAGGYLVPMDIIANPIVQQHVVTLVWNALRYRKRQLTDEEFRAANADVTDELKLIARGDMLLDAPESDDVDAPTGAVHAVASATRIFSRETLKDY